VQGFRLVNVDIDEPNGLDGIIAELKTHHDWVKQEEARYRDGPWPIAVFAHRTGHDTIDAAGGLAADGVPFKVALGNQPERDAAAVAVLQNAGKGCTLDLLAFWTAWCLGALETVAAICGPIHLPQTVMDRLRARRERFGFSAKDGMRSASYNAGKLALREVSAEVVVEWRNEIDQAINWAEINTVVAPLVAGDNLPTVLREQLRTGRSDIFDTVALSIQTGLLLVTDDLPMRKLRGLGSGCGGVWLHHIFMMALDRGSIDLPAYVRWTADIIEAGHSYISVNGRQLLQALRMDIEAAQSPDYYFKALTKMIGGRTADPRSHIAVCRDFLRALWIDYAALGYRQPATGLILSRLLHERVDDYPLILSGLALQVDGLPALVNYIHCWAHGHFTPEALISGWYRRG
jgi:cellulose synthase operon protein C